MSEGNSSGHLSPEQRRELLAKLLRERELRSRAVVADAGGLQQPLPRSPRVLPQSCAQQRMWLLEQLDTDGTCYNIVTYVTLRGALRSDLVERAFQILVARHETLRTTFRSDGTEPVQVVLPVQEFRLTTIDLTPLQRNERFIEIQKKIAAQQVMPFDLEGGPLLRVTLLCLGDLEHVLITAMHHIISDAWSMGVLMRDLGAAYSQLLEGGSAVLPALPIQYADYAIWQRRWLEGNEPVKQLDYWQKKLAGLQPLELPTDMSRPMHPKFRGGQRQVLLSRELSVRLRELSKRCGKTTFMTILAAFAALLSRVSGQADVSIGCPISNRNRSELEPLVGFFVNMLVLRIDLSGAPSFEELLERAGSTALEAYANQEYPFERLVENLSPDRELARNALFQVALSLHSDGIAPPQLSDVEAGEVLVPGYTVGGLDVPTQRARYELEMHLWDHADGIRGTLVYDADLFKLETIDHLIESWTTLLESAVEDPLAPISKLLLISPRQAKLVAEWGSNPGDYSRDDPVHAIFERHVLQNPHATAVVDGERVWTYQELDARANHIANRLLKLGVRQGELVSILLPRSGEALAAMLGTLKAGAVYVPLDPGYPAERIAFMLNDAGSAVVLTSPALRQLVPEHVKHTLCVDDVLVALPSADPALHLSAGIRGGDPAFVMYTSGSTGTPKGVIIPHRAISRLVLNTDYARFGPEQTVLQMATLSFDASTPEIWGALLNGARCVIYPPSVPSPREIGQILRRHRVTTMVITTAMLNAIIDHDPHILAPLEQIIFGGEPASAAHMSRAINAVPHVRLLNCYGPTEVATIGTCQHLSNIPDEYGGPLPIGRPIRHTSVALLDEQHRLVPPGVLGEIYLGGDGVGLGYLNRRELSLQRFLTPPGLTGRWYRTGDIGRWHADGHLEFHGRKDQQVKVRGVRIELTEVEAALAACQGVKAATVIVTGEGTERQLVAYVVLGSQPGELRWDALRAQLQRILPDYMIPAQCVQLPKLPLTPNGKIDRRALPQVQPERRLSQAAVSADNPLEKRISEIWRDALRLENVGVTDNFFDLGGHSLLLLQVHERLIEELKVGIPVVDLFQYPTVRSLAEHLARLESAPGEAGAGVMAARARATRQRQAMQARQPVATEAPQT